MDAQTWLAGLGGGLEAIDKTKHDDEELKLANRKVDAQTETAQLRAEIQSMLGQLRADTSTGNNKRNNATRSDIAGNAETGRNDRFYDAEAGKDSRFYTGEEGKNTRASNALDQSSEQYWDKAGRDWSGMLMTDSTRRRGQDVTARGQDLGASTAARGQDLTHGDRQDAMSAGSDSRAMSYALRAYDEELKRKKAAGPFGGDSGAPSFADWLTTSDDPEIFPSVRQQFGGSRGAAPAAPAAAPAPAPGAIMGDGLPPAARPAMPAPRRPMPPPAAAAPKGLAPGATVKLKNGKTVTVTKVNPDGTFEYQ